MTTQEHFVGQFAYGLQKGIGIAFPAFAQDDAIRLIGVRKLGTKIDLDFILDAAQLSDGDAAAEARAQS